ncbi:hypothetical protein M501DRAFT_936264 [Patellaria atrata CBS 101060]|uniref:LDB19 N-terminal domain-containing protein n=1 Tax=Patellaria atrata CBS 101060 TaxID=1346257 RepID=A0A9P4VQ90_9PEZI|nr:hypothetical protein M501DRAFT_936264 [Patellaria atrata CBS 101060]
MKRLSIGGKHLVHDHKHKKSPKLEAHKVAKLDMIVESPPMLLLGTPQTSQGALFSARMRFDVLDPAGITLEKFDARLDIMVNVSKPVEKHCAECSTQVTELKKWDFLSQPLKLKHGSENRQFPFSYLLPGHLPATTHGHLAQIEYILSVRATTTTGDIISFKQPIEIKRAVAPGNEKVSTRVFPPTNITAHISLDPVIHPIGDFPVTLRISGVTTKNEQSQTRWRLRRLLWRIDEHEKMIVPACPKHSAKLGGEHKGILREEDPRPIAQEEVKTPWKSDFEAGDIHAEFHAAINTRLKPSCNVEAENGLGITHTLVLELVIAEEWAPNKKPNQATPTGAARVLKTSLQLTVTERAGLGISWDEEQPPMYEDVPASPPTYNTIEEFDTNDLEEAPEYSLEQQ